MSSANERKACPKGKIEISLNIEHEYLEYFSCCVLKHSYHCETVRKSLAQQFSRVTACKATPLLDTCLLKHQRKVTAVRQSPKYWGEKGTVHAFLKG